MSSHLPDLEDVSATCSSCFHKLDILEHISLLPCFVGRLAHGVCEYLNKKLLRYSENYRGVLLAYSKPCVQQSHGRILDEQPHIHFDLKYTAYVFRPVIGSVVCGTVNNVGGDHVGCLVYECFNASVFSTSQDGKERRKLNGLFTSKFQIGSKIWFRVVSIENNSGILSIVGEYFDLSKFSEKRQNRDERGKSPLMRLDSSLELTGHSVSDKDEEIDGSVDKHVEKSKKKKKRSKSKKGDEEQEGESLAEHSHVESDVDSVVNVSNKKKKHKKKSKTFELASEGEEEEKRLTKKRKNLDSLSEVPKKKKKTLLAEDTHNELASVSKKQHKRKR